MGDEGVASAVIDSVDRKWKAVGMSSAEVMDAMAKLKRLSMARAKRVVSLIEDLSELEALENTADLQAAHEALAEAEEPLRWDEVKARLDAQFGVSQPSR